MKNLDSKLQARLEKYVDPLDDWFKRLPSVLLLRACVMLIVGPVLVSAIILCVIMCILDIIKGGLMKGNR